MKTHLFCRFCLTVALAAGLIGSAVGIDNVPVWKATMPDPSFSSSTSSISSILSESPASTLAVLSHYSGGAAGLQLVLIGAQGQILATGEVLAAGGQMPIITPLSVTPRKVVVLFSVQGWHAIRIGRVDAAKHLVLQPVSFQSLAEQMVYVNAFTTARNPIFTSTTVNGKMVEIRRYSLPKLLP